MIARLLPLLALGWLLSAAPAIAQSPSMPYGFTARTVTANGASIHLRTGGNGPPVVLLHGYTQTGDMWGPLAAELVARGHTVLVPDLRGLGRSSRPETGYDKMTAARDIRATVRALGLDRAAVVGHDIGTMVAYAYAAQFPDAVERLVLMEAPLPGIGQWDEIRLMPLTWHFDFHGRHAERITAGRERIFLDRFWDEFAANPAAMGERARAHYAAEYAAPGAMRAGFAYFAAFPADAEDNRRAAAERKLRMPVLAIGGERSFGTTMEAIVREVATDVIGGVIPGAGHWLMEEAPDATVALVAGFVAHRR
jgi:pimeloyl-ACP methyl ester carboxylesterase